MVIEIFFIIQSKWEDREDIGCIMDLDMNILTFFLHSEKWKPPRSKDGRFLPRLGKGLTADFWLETNDGTKIGEIYGFPAPLYSVIRRNNYEIYNTENKLVGVVWEKIKQFGSKWVLEDSESKIIAMIKGNRREKNYKVISQKNQMVARCYRNSGIPTFFSSS